MRLLDLQRDACEHLIPIRGWQSVEYALTAYACGDLAQPREREARADLEQTFTAAFGVEAGYLVGRLGGGDLGEFARGLLQRARDALQQRDVWSASFDCDGPGPFYIREMAERVVQVLTAPPESEQLPHALLWEGESLKHTIYVKNIPYYYDSDSPGEVWNADGGRMFGPLERACFDAGAPPRLPGLVYEVRGTRTPEGFRFSLPLFERGLRDLALSHIDLVCQRLSPLLVRPGIMPPEQAAR